MDIGELLANVFVFIIGIFILGALVNALKISFGPLIIALFIIGSISWFIKEVFL
jgi:hypothetical protein